MLPRLSFLAVTPRNQAVYRDGKTQAVMQPDRRRRRRHFYSAHFNDLAMAPGNDTGYAAALPGVREKDRTA